MCVLIGGDWQFGLQESGKEMFFEECQREEDSAFGSEGCFLSGSFLKAGRLVGVFSTSVSPLEKVVDEDEGFGERGLPEGLKTEELERIGLEEEGEFIRGLVDPRLPTEEEVKLHELRGHVEYRNWCSVCVRCRGKRLDHRS